MDRRIIRPDLPPWDGDISGLARFKRRTDGAYVRLLRCDNVRYESKAGVFIDEKTRRLFIDDMSDYSPAWGEAPKGRVLI